MQCARSLRVFLLAITAAAALTPRATLARGALATSVTPVPIALRATQVEKHTTAEEDARTLLLQMGRASTALAPAKSQTIDALMRREPAEREAILDAALAIVASSADSRLARWRLPIRIPSRRATIGCFRRLLETMEAEEPGSSARFQDSDTGRRRRFLLVLLRQACDSRSVWALEREAQQRRAQAGSMEEMLRRTPDGLETPAYSVLSERSNWEVRRYDEFSVVTTLSERPVSDGGRKLQAPTMPAAGAFQALAGYIFGGNGAGEKMSMTTPVISRRRAPGVGGDGAVDESSRSMEMSFVMPSSYWKATEQAPSPAEGSGVEVRRAAGGVLADSDTLGALWFGGFAGAAEVEARQRELLEAISNDEEWDALPGEPLLLQYNDPFTPPWKRRNEVAVPVRQRE